MFLPVCKKDLIERQMESVDFIFVTGDAYVDHPSFGVAIIARVLEAQGYTIAILSQPRWEVDDDFLQFGTPRLGFLVTSGNLDSIVNNYTVSKRRRDEDSYSEGGKIGKRPDYAVVVYSNIIRRLFSEKPIIIGGIEASLRRLAHYDYLQNKIKKSILIDSKADLIAYGMGEQTITEIADALKSGLNISDIIYLKGTVWKTKEQTLLPTKGIFLPSYKELMKDKLKYAESFNIQYNNTDPYNGEVLIEAYDDYYVVQNTATMPFTREYLDWVYSLDYERTYHPMYKEVVPAIEEVKFSIAINRGCMGSCSFCALTFHQGRIIQSRSKESVVEEAKRIISDKDFKGYIHDIGGPTANFYVRACDKQEEFGACKNRKCLYPTKCPNLLVSHKEYLEILREVRQLDKVKKVFIRSGIRYDYLMYDNDDEFFEELVKYHISGQLKVAPEHVSNRVLDMMQKPHFELYEKFTKKYYALNNKYNKKQFLVPYLMSSHPGSELGDAIKLAEYLHKNNIRVDQVQDFYPTPGTLSTCMYYTEVDPRNMKKIYVAKSGHEKAMQRALIQYNKEKNYHLVREALELSNRKDLIGNGKDCLIKIKKTFKK
ncbi:MAG: YgiQ family radical SAM protein [Bacilli bacterium]|nr:YgiQ family radical SAM protein [Bacilli bacterium]